MGVAGLRLEFVERGTGIPVIFIHGGMTDLRTWHKQMEPLGEKYHVIAYSRRSHYPNDWIEYPPDYSVKTEVQDLVGFIEGLGLTTTPAHVIGNSYGGTIAAFAALNYPQLIRSLVLAEPGLFSLLLNYPWFQERWDDYKRKVQEPIAQRLQSGDLEEVVVLQYNRVMGTNLTYSQIPEEYRMMLMQNVRTIKSEAGMPSFSPDDAKRIMAPVLLVDGEQSLPSFRAVIEELQRLLPKSERVTIRNASHGMYNQNPESFNEVVLRFLAAH